MLPVHADDFRLQRTHPSLGISCDLALKFKQCFVSAVEQSRVAYVLRLGQALLSSAPPFCKSFINSSLLQPSHCECNSKRRTPQQRLSRIYWEKPRCQNWQFPTPLRV